MEYCDVYNADGKKTGRVAIRGAWRRGEGEYLLSVHIIIRNSKGEYLIQKRSKSKRSLPGMWNLTCGMVDAGETDIDAIQREIKEEIGIDIDKESAVYGGRVILKALFADIWLVTADFELSDCVLQADEVADVRWVSREELMELISSANHRTDAYKEIVERLIAE